MEQKKEKLFSIIKGYGSLLVAFSGGVDSSFLLTTAHQALKKNLIAVIGTSSIHPEREKAAALKFAKNLGVELIILQTREMGDPGFLANTKDRCYICKKNLITDLWKIASKRKIRHIAHGANMDDLDDFRPGFKAADEMDVKAPLIDAGLTKNDIRMLSKQMKLATWNKPSMACLATRIPYGRTIKESDIKMVESAEQVITDLGFKLCRVRLCGDTGRIEIDPEKLEQIVVKDVRRLIIKRLKKIGFSHISIDIQGYRQGSMNKH